jgi:photosystem II stability/assembly factor-like uncharacterized protein
MKLREVLLALAFTLVPLSNAYALKYDVLELPSVPSDLASKSLIFSVDKFGDRYFATGHFGHILYSDDGGDTWTQAEVPVRSSITGIDFPTPELGWAVGHEGVILHSSDGGKTWVKQYDGNRYGHEGLAYYKKLAEANPDNEDYPYLVEEMEFAISQGADKPLFGVRFHSPTYGHVMGAYGMILRTTDGGQNWEHVLHNMENDSYYHIFDFAPLPEEGKFFLSGEAGLFMVGDVKEQTGKKINSIPWEGSFFASTDTADGAIVMGGLRGRMFRTTDAGDSWTVVKKPPTSAIVDLARLEDDSLIAVSIGGQVLMSKDNGLTFAPLPITGGMPGSIERIYTVAEGPKGTILVGGPSGIRKLALPQ